MGLLTKFHRLLYPNGSSPKDESRYIESLFRDQWPDTEGGGQASSSLRNADGVELNMRHVRGSMSM